MSSNLHSPILFFKIITTPSLEAGNLKLPNDFTRKYGGGMSNPMFIKPPDGNEWKVYHSNIHGDVWFQNGWEAFAKYYSLDHGHMVLFKYKGASHFEVHIFDKSTLEIEYSKHGNQDELNNNNPNESGDDSVEILDEILPPCKKTKLKSPMPCPKPLKKLRTSTSEDVRIRIPKLQNLHKQVQIEGDQSKATNFTFEHVKKELEDSGADGNTERLKEKQIKRLNRSKDASFKVVIKPYSCAHGHSLSIPSEFGQRYMKKKMDVQLEVLDGRTWSVSYNILKFNSGWHKFASDNNLKVGDICVFELTKRDPFSFKVLIVPHAQVERLDEIPPRKITKLKSSMQCPQPRKKLRTSTSEDVRRRPKLLNLHKQVKIEGNQSKAKNFQKSTSKPVKKELEDCAGGTTECLEEEDLTSKVTEALNRSKDVSFKVVIKTYSCAGKHSLSIPSEFGKKYMKKKKMVVQLEVLDRGTWSVNYNPLKFCAGWNKFASDNNLKEGDVCVFELTKRDPFSFKVLIFPHGQVQSEGDNRETAKRTSKLISPQYFTSAALEEANKFTSNNPFFIISLMPDMDRYYRPCVPTHFMREYFGGAATASRTDAGRKLKCQQHKIMLQFEKNLWPVNLICTRQNYAGKLSRGWMEFVAESKLVGGDALVFELINKDDPVLDVHIYKAH